MAEDNQNPSNNKVVVNKPRVGMNLDSSPKDIQGSEYSLAVNANIFSQSGDAITITNEHSNLLCSRFKEGYKVIGLQPINVQSKTIYFLVDPINHKSEIGQIKNISYDDSNDRESICDTCNHPIIEDKPLEDTIQYPNCVYETIVNTDCLNFNINNPISSTFEIGIDVDSGLPDCNNVTIFFTDALNSRRYLNLNNIPRKIIGYDSGNCNTPNYSQELDCDSIRVASEYPIGCITAVDIVTGGQLLGGVYEFTAAYSTIDGKPLTDYFGVSNPTSIFAQQNATGVKIDFPTNSAIKIQINNIDTGFQYLNIAVLKTINNTTSIFLVGTFNMSSNQFLYTYTGNNYANEERLNLDDILGRKTVYEGSKGVAKAGGRLYFYDLLEQRIINLQPVVNTISLRWQTVETNEGLYSNGILASQYTGYERDEVYAFGIEFQKSNGFKLATFPFVGKDKDYYQNRYNINVDSIQTGFNVLESGGCDSLPLNKLWQVYNTAQVIGEGCNYTPPSSGVQTIREKITCYSDQWVDGDLNIPDKCCIVGVDDCQCIQIELRLALPSSGIPTYDKNIAIPKPVVNDTHPIPQDWSTPDFVPINTKCILAENLSVSNTSLCIVTTYVLLKCGSGAPGNDNSMWYSFRCQNQDGVHAIRFATPFQFDHLIELYDNCTSIVPLACTSNNYLLCENLVPNNTYYIRISTGDGTTCSSPLRHYNCIPIYDQDVDGDKYKGRWGTLCMVTPVATGTKSGIIPAIYQWKCTYLTTPKDITTVTESPCKVQTYQYGDFAYNESTATYPNNPDVWSDLCGKPIRHFKFPDCCVSHIHNNPDIISFGTIDKIYPIGLRLDTEEVKNALNQAVNLGLINESEKLEITGYKIKRGNRRTSRSIVAKGLLYDIWRTPALDTDGAVINKDLPTFIYYPNYPYNDLNNDIFLLNQKGGQSIEHPYINNNSSKINGRYTFHSPNTSFARPFLGSELKIETVEYGKSVGQYNEVLKHSEYVVLTGGAVGLAIGLAELEIIFDAFVAAAAAGEGFKFLGSSPGSIVTFAIEFAIGIGIGQFNLPKYVQQWEEIFLKLGNPVNPAIYYTSVGRYNSYCCINPAMDSTVPTRRTIKSGSYLEPGNFEFTEYGNSIRINNFERESSVYLNLDVFTNYGTIIDNKALVRPDFYCSEAFDNSRTLSIPELDSLNSQIQTDIGSYYASIKNYVPDQYGTIDQIEWIDTGHCGVIDWNNEQDTKCDTIFGGDTFINRFSIKRKFPFYIQDRVNFNINADIRYSILGNVGKPAYWFDSLLSEASGTGASSFSAVHNNFIVDRSSTLYQKGKIPLYSYGIPSFLCESDYNLDLRHAEENGTYKDFYPHVGDIVDWTQQYKTPIYYDNTYYYNIDYSKQLTETFTYLLKNNFKTSDVLCRTSHPNRVIYSPEGVSFWLDNLANNYYDFPIEDGKLIAVNGIERDRVVVRQENSTKIFNAYITQQATPLGEIQIGIEDIFATKPIEVYKTDLGFGGTTNVAFESTPYGHFYVDTQNPSIFQLQGDSLTDITKGKDGKSKIKMWMREFFPFSIIKDFPEVDTDNNYKYFGIATTYDNKFDRVFFTKRDTKLLSKYKNIVKFDATLQEFYILENDQRTYIFPWDTKYFCNRSFTIAYNPIIGEFISFYSFTPNYYNSTETYFQSGINYSTTGDSNELGLYSHLLTNKSYTVFYGKKYPFIIEFVTQDDLTNYNFNNLQWQSDYLRYESNLSWSKINDITLSHLVAYNQNQSTGLLNLVMKQKNNLFQTLQYPRIENFATSILTENVENFQKANQFVDISLNNGQSLMIYECGNPYKTINQKSISLQPVFYKNYLQGDYFICRFEDRVTSNYKILFKYNFTGETKSNT